MTLSKTDGLADESKWQPIEWSPRSPDLTASDYLF